MFLSVLWTWACIDIYSPEENADLLQALHDKDRLIGILCSQVAVGSSQYIMPPLEADTHYKGLCLLEGQLECSICLDTLADPYTCVEQPMTEDVDLTLLIPGSHRVAMTSVVPASWGNMRWMWYLGRYSRALYVGCP